MALHIKHLSKIKNCKELEKIKTFILKNPKESFPHKNLQKGYLNFYEKESITPYVPVNAHGPWVVTSTNDIIYDTGGYGMLGLGHNDPKILECLSKPQVMANIMTPSFSQKNFFDIFRKEVNKNYEKIVCLNSGSEANTFACTLANIHTHPRPVKVCLKGSFHGRTEQPSTLSDSTRDMSEKYLSSFKKQKRMKLPRYPTMIMPKRSSPKQKFTKEIPLRHATEPWGNLEDLEQEEIKYNTDGKIYTVTPNCFYSLEHVFQQISLNFEYPELTIFEPVMGEGDPGLAITPEFYSRMRELTTEHNGLLISDSIQAGLRCQGTLSITNYPGFENLPPPDMETFSKALNGGQYPFSVVALNERASKLYKCGLYGNTMTSNPRALDIASTTLTEVDKKVRKNIVTQGKYFLDKIKKLEKEYDFIDRVNGTGLLLSIFFNRSHVSNLQVEQSLRFNGLNVIHGGQNSIRMTPWFKISKEEVDMICDILNESFKTLSK